MATEKRNLIPRCSSALLTFLGFLTLLLAQSSQAAELQTVQVGGEASESLAALEEKIVAAAEKAKRSVVRISWINDRTGGEESYSGVILNAAGYVGTCAYKPSSESDDLPSGKAVLIQLADGRCVPGIAVGSFWRFYKTSFGLVKITEAAVWPHAETGTSRELKPGEVCLALGYPSATNGGRLPYEREPSVRIGHIVPTGVSGLLRTSCRTDCLADRGGGLFDIEGRLVGLHIGYGLDVHTEIHCTIETVERHRGELVGRELPADGAIPGHVEQSNEPPDEPNLPPLPSKDDPRLKAAGARARQATVGITAVGPKRDQGFSGIVMTPDGYVATCAHHGLARGTDATIHFADGRTTPARLLGSNLALDIGLARITAPGPWPHAQWGNAIDAKTGDLCLLVGYPNRLRRNGQVPVVVRVGRIEDARAAPLEFRLSCKSWDGDSGGGHFDSKGRLIGVNVKFGGSAGADLFKRAWNLLVSGPSLDDPVPFDASPAADALRKAIEHVPSITVEVLGDEKRWALGTVVSTDGHVLTKASELYGDLSCRLADGRALKATVLGVSRPHDLALLKIEATGLPQIPWSRREHIPVGTFVGALRYGESPAVGAKGLDIHAVIPTAGYLGIGEMKDAEGGIEVLQLKSRWGSDPSKSPIRKGDIIVHIEGRPTPNVRTFEDITTPDRGGRGVPFVLAGDPIHMGVKRGGQALELRFPVLSHTDHPDRVDSPRKTGFPAVFDTDALITLDTCGGPVVDRTGQVVGITIALPTPERVYVVPAAVARKVLNKLMDEVSE